ncbi:trithorax group protein osa-like [Hippocampus zosterae]|uniref:trithorax group protein osa-like n=1 Tax=Hippocampus zosterae TaxID=109293 RepID=UPI00223D8F11|nr:trithorax group protein osa-like [Hippocampus zosterae]
MAADDGRERYLSSKRLLPFMPKLPVSSPVVQRVLDMGPGLAARFSWMCLLLFSNAANVPVQHKYHPRPLYKPSAGPAPPSDGLRPSLMTLQKQHSKVHSAVQDSDPTPESQAPSSLSTPGVASSGFANQGFVAYAGNSDKPSSAPAPPANKYANAPSSGSRWALYDQTFRYKPTNSGDQAGMANAGVQRPQSWVLQSSGDKTSTGGLNLDAVKGQPAVTGGGNLPPSWAEYISVYEPPSSYQPPTASLPPSGVKVGNPQANLPIGWAAYHPIAVQPSGRKPSLGQVDEVKGQLLETPAAGVPSNWPFNPVYMPSSTYESTAPEVTSGGIKGSLPGKGKGQAQANLGGNLPPSWTLFNQVFTSSGYETPTAPESPVTAKEQPAANPGGYLKGWQVYSPVYVQPPSYKPATGSVDAVKGQQASHPSGTMQKSWTAYGSVEAQPSSSKPATGGLVKGQSASSPGDHLQQGWATYSQVYPPSVFKPPTAPGGTMQKSWTAYGSVDAQPSSSKPATGGLVKGQSASSPGDHLQQSWAAYSQVYPPSSFKPPTLPGPVKGQPAAHPGGTLQQNWAAYGETYQPTDPVVLPGTVQGQQTSLPGAAPEQSWTAYSSVEAQPPSSKPTTGGGVKGQPAPSPIADLHPSWSAYSQVYEPVVRPAGVKGSPHGTVHGQQAFIQSGKLPLGWIGYGPVNVKPATGSTKVNLEKGQSAVNPTDSLLPSWALFNPVFTSSGFESPTAPESPITSKGQPAANPADNLPKSWAVYSSGHVHPPNYKPSAGGVKQQQQVANAGDLHQNWAAYSQVGHSQTALDIVRGQPAVNPVGAPQRSWAAYDSVEVQPSSSKHETGQRNVDPVKGQRTVNPAASLPPNWAMFNPGYLSSSDSEFPTGSVKVSHLDSGRRQAIVDGNQPQSWVLGHPMYEPAVPESSVPGKDQPSAKPYGKLHKGWAMYSPVDVRPSTYKPSTGVDAVKGQPVLNAGGNVLPHWPAYSQVYHPPASPVVSPPSTVMGQLASHPGGNLQQSWAAYISGTGMGQSPGWVKVAAPAGKGQHAFSEANLAPSTGGATGHTGIGQPEPHPDGNVHQNWAAYSHLKLPFSYQPSGTGNEQLEALPGAKPPAAPSNQEPSGVGVQVRPSIRKGKPAANPGGNQHPKWTSYSSAHYWSPGFNPSVAPVPSPVGAHVSLPAGAGNWGAGSVSGAKLGSAWAAYRQINPSLNYKPSGAPGSGQQSSQGAAKQVSGSFSSGGLQVRSQNELPAHPVGLLANWPYLRVDSNDHATSGLKGYDSAGVPNRSPLKWISSHPGHPGQALVQFPMEARAPWLSSQVFAAELPEEDDDDDEEEEELPTYIVRNRNGYRQWPKEFSRMHYFQKDEQPYVPYLRRSPKV